MINDHFAVDIIDVNDNNNNNNNNIDRTAGKKS
jgi:hypothetical protein